LVLEKDEEDLLDRSSEKWKRVAKRQGGKYYPTYDKNEGG
jgi:hypothetical protein